MKHETKTRLNIQEKWKMVNKKETVCLLPNFPPSVQFDSLFGAKGTPLDLIKLNELYPT